MGRLKQKWLMNKSKGYDSSTKNRQSSNFHHGGNVFSQAKRLNLSPSAIIDSSASLVPFKPPLILLDSLNSEIKNLSNSILKKIAFARALIHNPDFLLLDNPTSEMDYHDRNIFFNIINEIKKNKTILLISNNFEESEIYSDRIIIMHNGCVSINGSMKNILDSMGAIYKYRISFKRLVPNDY